MKKPLKFLRIDEVCERTGLKKSSLYDLMAERKFPRPVKIGGAARWPEHEVVEIMEAWIASRDAVPGRAA